MVTETGFRKFCSGNPFLESSDPTITQKIFETNSSFHVK